ncbi:transcriptional regulator [Lysobacteraceae bacterium NML93-0399]|nr:transcriptional regulator [Xanthomonadaceae bacterium NML93-0399]
MIASHSKSMRLYGQLRRAVLCGRFTPGQRLEPATLAHEFDTSLTPVRFALYRLSGEGLVNDQARDGFYMPLPTEAMLRDLYEWMEHLLLMACDRGATPNGRAHMSIESDAGTAKATWQLFDSIARRTPQRALHHAARRTNDQLAPIRSAKRSLVPDAAAEFADLARAWERADIENLKAALRAYHARRRQLVPTIVDVLNQARDALH